MKKKLPIITLITLGALFLLYAASKTAKQIKMVIETPKDYIKLMYPIALKVQSLTGIPYLFMLAQTALETRYGTSSLFKTGFNIGGIKAKDGQPFIEAWTWEHVSDPNKYPNRDKTKDKLLKSGKTAIRIKSKFAKFNSLEEGVKKWTEIILKPRYKAAFNYKTDPKKFAAEIKAGGYATDVNYVSKLSKLIDNVKNLI